MENNNPSPTPEDVPESTGTSSSWSTSLATTSVARDATRGTGDGRGSRASTSSQPATSLMTYFLLLLRDLLTFFVRGGLSAMMFAMDQVLRVLSLAADVFLGPTGQSSVRDPAQPSQQIWRNRFSRFIASAQKVFYFDFGALKPIHIGRQIFKCHSLFR